MEEGIVTEVVKLFSMSSSVIQVFVDASMMASAWILTHSRLVLSTALQSPLQLAR
jgi:hypothetical protein